mgnify:CR=1 FL=1
MKSEKLVSLVKEMADYGGAVEKNSGGITYYKNRYGYVLGAQGESWPKSGEIKKDRAKLPRIL